MGFSFYCKNVLSDFNEWGNQFLMMLHSRDMVFSLIFSHLSHYQLKIADYSRAMLKSRVFDILICNRSTLIVVKIRGQSVSDSVLLSRYGIFSHFQPF